MADAEGILSRIDPPATVHDTEVDTCDLSLTPRSAMNRPAPATQADSPSQMLTPQSTPKRRARRETERLPIPQARVLFPREPTHPQPEITPVHRATGQPVNLRANFVAYLGWRWRIRAQPPLNGVARLSPKVALEDWLAKHRENSSPESVRVVQARLDNWDQAPENPLKTLPLRDPLRDPLRGSLSCCPYSFAPLPEGFFRRGFCKNVRLSWLWRSKCQMYC